MSGLLKLVLGGGLFSVGTLASLWAAAGTGSGSLGRGVGSAAQVPELSLGSAGLAAVLLGGTALLLAEKQRKAVRA
jgi:hypothetical protein